MSTGQSAGARRGWAVAVPLLTAAVCGVGCAGGQRRGCPPGPYQSDFPTVGSDLKCAPRGITIPPPGLGVDLVGHSRGVTSDPVIPASLP
jgi:hypothetical protein